MNKQWLTVIERAVFSAQDLFPLNQTWQAIHREYNIGLAHGKKLRLTQQDKLELRELVKQTMGLDLQMIRPQSLAGLQREQVLRLANNEKLAGQSVKHNRLALKVIPGKTLKLNGENFSLPKKGHWDSALEDIVSVEHQSLWIIENFRCFDQLEAIQFHESATSTDPLIVFRGDNAYPAQGVNRLIEKLNLPVWVMGDIDPQGLSIAQAYPHFAGLVAPEIAVLTAYLSDPNKANPTLYAKQLAGCQQVLANSRFPLIKASWQLIQDHQAGVVQEHWLANTLSLHLLPASMAG